MTKSSLSVNVESKVFRLWVALEIQRLESLTPTSEKESPKAVSSLGLRCLHVRSSFDYFLRCVIGKLREVLLEAHRQVSVAPVIFFFVAP